MIRKKAMRSIVLNLIALLAVALSAYIIYPKKLLVEKTISNNKLKAKTIFSKPIDKSLRGLVKFKQNFNNPCKIIWKNTINMPLNSFVEDFVKGEIKKSERCVKFESEHLSEKIMSLYNNNCRNIFQGLRQNIDKCVDALTYYRAHLIDNAFNERSHIKKYSASILMNKIISRVFHNASVENTLYNLEIIDELIRREPKLYAAHKAKAMNLMINRYLNGVLDPTIDLVFKDCEKYSEGDPELFDMKVAAYAEDERLLMVIDKYISKNPHDGRGYYNLGYFYWKKKSKLEALKVLTVALEKDPKNKRYMKTLRIMRNKKAGDSGVFILSATFSFTNI